MFLSGKSKFILEYQRFPDFPRQRKVHINGKSIDSIDSTEKGARKVQTHWAATVFQTFRSNKIVLVGVDTRKGETNAYFP